MNDSLQTLLARPDVWQASRGSAANERAGALPTGHAALDQALHRGGWPLAALTEVLGDDWGIGEMQLLAPVLAHCGRGQRRLFFVSPPYLPYAPYLLAQGIRLERLLVVRPEQERDTLWSTEQILRSGAAACLLAWLPESRQADYHALRRLQLAAQRSSCPAFLFRPGRAARSVSPAALRIVLQGGREQLGIEILKQRGGRAGQQIALARAHALLQPRIDPALLPVLASAVAGSAVGPASAGRLPPHLAPTWGRECSAEAEPATAGSTASPATAAVALH